MNQKQKILNLLDDGRWHCSSEMYAMYLADPRKRLHELKQAGYILESRWCKDHPHEGLQKQWRLIATPKNYEPSTFSKRVSQANQKQADKTLVSETLKWFQEEKESRLKVKSMGATLW